MSNQIKYLQILPIFTPVFEMSTLGIPVFLPHSFPISSSDHVASVYAQSLLRTYRLVWLHLLSTFLFCRVLSHQGGFWVHLWQTKMFHHKICGFHRMPWNSCSCEHFDRWNQRQAAWSRCTERACWCWGPYEDWVWWDSTSSDNFQLPTGDLQHVPEW